MSPEIIGPFRGKTGHKAEALMVCCMDFRFQEAFNKFLETRNFAGCDVVEIAGGVKEWKQVKEHVDLAVSLHHVEKVILVNHRFCGAYGEKLQRDHEEELATHTEDLLTTAQKIKEKYPHLEVETWFAEMIPKGEASEIIFIKI